MTIKHSDNDKTRHELNWHEPTARWRKRKNIGGQTKYFHYAHPNTARGYRLALADWKRDLAQVQQVQQELSRRKRNERARALAAIEADRKDVHPDWSQTFRQIVRDLDAGHDVDEAGRRAAMLMSARGNLREGNYEKASNAAASLIDKGADDKTQPLFGNLLDEYLVAQLRRVEHGKKHPSAPRRERLGEATYVTMVWTVKSLQKSLGLKRVPSDERDVAKLLRDYRSEQVDLLNTDTIKPNTFNERIKILRHILGWGSKGVGYH